MPGGLAVAGLFGGAVVLAALAIAGPSAGTGSSGSGSTGSGATGVGPSVAALIAPAALVALVVVIASGIVLARRLRQAARDLADTARQVEEAGSRVKVRVDLVPAAV